MLNYTRPATLWKEDIFLEKKKQKMIKLLTKYFFLYCRAETLRFITIAPARWDNENGLRLRTNIARLSSQRNFTPACVYYVAYFKGDCFSFFHFFFSLHDSTRLSRSVSLTKCKQIFFLSFFWVPFLFSPEFFLFFKKKKNVSLYETLL